jgi:hypothetical protein
VKEKKEKPARREIWRVLRKEKGTWKTERKYLAALHPVVLRNRVSFVNLTSQERDMEATAPRVVLTTHRETPVPFYQGKDMRSGWRTNKQTNLMALNRRR